MTFRWWRQDRRPKDPDAAESDREADAADSEPPFGRLIDFSSAYQRRTLITFALLLLSLPVILYGAHNSLAGILTLTSRWLPDSFTERQVLDEFMRDFESGDSVFITWSDCRLDDSRLHALGERLDGLTAASPDSDSADLIESVLTGSDVVDSLTAKPSQLTQEEAAARLRGILVGADGAFSGALVSLTQKGVQQRERVMELILAESSLATGIPRDEFILAGPPIDGWVIDRQAKSDVDMLTPPSMFISILLCLWCLRSQAHSAAVLTSALAAQGILLAIMYIGGIRMNALFIVLPQLVLTLTMSSGLHLANYYRDERDSGGIEGAARRAMRQGRGPCLLAAGTTAIGLLSLVRSDITPVAQFGWLAAVGVLIGVAFLFLLLPGMLQRRPGQPAADFPTRTTNSSPGASTRRPYAISGAPTLLIVFFLGLMTVLGTGVSSIRTSITHDSLFADDSRIVRDYQQLEDRLGPLVPAEVLLHFEPGHRIDFLKRLQLIQELDEAIAGVDGFGGTLSAAIYDVEGARAALSRDERLKRSSRFRRLVKLRAQLKRLQSTLVDARLLHETEDRQTWRISTRVPALGDVDYAESMQRLQNRVEQVLDAHRNEGMVVTSAYTGIMPMVSRVQKVLLRDLIASFLSAFGLVALITIVVLRSIPAGLLVMLPNLFPAVVVFGAMGWLQIPVDIGAMMTASVALGIAVDDTFHFLTWFRRGTQDGLTAPDAVRLAYSRCARAMVQTTLICGLGIAVFSFSGFIPTQRFAWLMLTLLLTALIGDLVFLPALLSGIMRRVFVSNRSN